MSCDELDCSDSEGYDTESEEDEGLEVFEAIRGREVARLKELIAEGVDVNVRQPPRNLTPLHVACMLGDARSVECLLSANASARVLDACKLTPLHHAARRGHQEVVEMLLRSKRTAVDVLDNCGRTPAHLAALEGHTKTLQMLVTYGANVEAKDELKETPIFKAVAGRHQEAAAFLITKSNLEAVNCKRQTVLLLATSLNDVEMMKILLKAEANVFHQTETLHNSLMFAAARGYVEAASALLQSIRSSRGVKKLVNSENESGDSPLFFAAWSGCLQVVEVLVKFGADVNAKNKKSMTPLMHASYRHHPQIVKYLLKQGAKTTHKDKEGNNALFYAVHADDKADDCRLTLELLLDSGLNVDAKNSFKETALMHACQEGNREAVRVLVLRGCNKSLKDASQNTAKDFASPEIRCLLVNVEDLQSTSSYANTAYLDYEDASVIDQCTVDSSETARTDEQPTFKITPSADSDLMSAVKQKNAEAVRQLLPQSTDSEDCFQEAMKLKLDDIVLDIVHYQLQHGITFYEPSAKDKIIGSGRFGPVVEGSLNNGLKVTVKTLRKQRFFQDAVSYLPIRSQHIVRILGISFPSSDNIQLISERIHGMNLLDLIEEAFANSQKLKRSRVRNFGIQLTLGLQFLHSKELIHGNLTLKNALVTSDDLLKLCDCGQSPELGCFAAPELMALKTEHPTVSCDVYSCGVVILALATMDKRPLTSKNDRRRALKSAKSGKRLAYAIEGCLSRNKRKRMPLIEVQKSLESKDGE